MKISDKGLHQLVIFEGIRLRVYKDSAGLDTIGVGHLITNKEKKSGSITIDNEKIEYRNGLTRGQALALLRQDVVDAEDYVNTYVEVDIKQHHFDALVSFVFNVGVNAFLKSTLLKLLNKGHFETVPAQLLRWNRSGGRITPGLTKRRQQEGQTWSKALYLL